MDTGQRLTDKSASSGS